MRDKSILTCYSLMALVISCSGQGPYQMGPGQGQQMVAAQGPQGQPVFIPVQSAQPVMYAANNQQGAPVMMAGPNNQGPAGYYAAPGGGYGGQPAAPQGFYAIPAQTAPQQQMVAPPQGYYGGYQNMAPQQGPYPQGQIPPSNAGMSNYPDYSTGNGGGGRYRGPSRGSPDYPINNNAPSRGAPDYPIRNNGPARGIPDYSTNNGPPRGVPDYPTNNGQSRGRVDVIYNGVETVAPNEGGRQQGGQSFNKIPNQQGPANRNLPQANRPLLPPIPWLAQGGDKTSERPILPPIPWMQAATKPATKETSTDTVPPDRIRRLKTTLPPEEVVTPANEPPPFAGTSPDSRSNWIQMGDKHCQCNCDPFAVLEESVDSASSWLEATTGATSATTSTPLRTTTTTGPSTSTPSPLRLISTPANLVQFFQHFRQIAATTTVPSTLPTAPSTTSPSTTITTTRLVETKPTPAPTSTTSTSTKTEPATTKTEPITSQNPTTVASTSQVPISSTPAPTSVAPETTAAPITTPTPTGTQSPTTLLRSKREALKPSTQQLPVMPILGHSNNRLRFYNHCQCWCIEEK